jgi:uncharacterized protein YqkB
MKRKVIILSALAAVVLAVGCSKQKTCRCAVIGTSKVRVIKIESGECEDLKLFTYHTPLDSLRVDSLVCTDFQFTIDSVYNK